MKIKTKLTKLGRDPKKQKGFVNPGIYKGSTMIFNSFKDYLNDIKNDDDRKTLYRLHNAFTTVMRCYNNNPITSPKRSFQLINVLGKHVNEI